MSVFNRKLLLLSEIGLLVGLAAVLLARWQRDQLSFYIHPRYAWLVVSAAVVLALLALVRAPHLLSPAAETVSGGPLLMLAVPLLLATLVPPQPLNGATLLARGDQLNRIAASDRRELAEDTRSWDLLAWGYALSLDAEQLVGSPADVTGFVVPDQSAGPDTALLARYVVTCCAADGAAVGLLFAAPGAAAVPADSWVRAVGTIELREVGGLMQPVLVTEQLLPIEQPTVPYLFP